MSFIKQNSKVIDVTVKVNVHVGEEDKTVEAVKEILTSATPGEVDALLKLFRSDKRKWALSLAKSHL